MSQTEQTKRTFSGFLKAMAAGRLDADYSVSQKSGKIGYVSKAEMSEVTGAVGGYLVPTDFSEKILRSFHADSVIYQRATVVPMKSATTLCPILNATTAQSAGVSPYWGGMTFSWGFNQAATETEPTFRQVQLNAFDLIGYVVASNQFVADLDEKGDEFLYKMFGDAANYYAEYAFFRGTGAANLMPLGIVDAPGTKVVSRQVGNQISATDVAAVAAGMLPYGWRNAVWACSPTALAQIAKLSTFYLNAPAGSFDRGAGYAGRLLSRPLFVSDKLPALGTKGDLMFFDPSMYVVGDRMEVRVDFSPHPLFQSNQSIFRVWLRMDGKPILNGLVTMSDTTTTVGSQVALS